MKRRIIGRSQWNRQPGKVDLFHDTRRFVLLFLFHLQSMIVGMQLCWHSSPAECSFRLLFILVSFRLSTGECLSACVRDWCFVACLRPSPRHIERVRGTAVCVYLWPWMCVWMSLCCVLAPIGLWWMPLGLLRQRERKREAMPQRVLIASTFLPIIRSIALHRIPVKRSIR